MVLEDLADQDRDRAADPDKVKVDQDLDQADRVDLDNVVRVVLGL